MPSKPFIPLSHGNTIPLAHGEDGSKWLGAIAFCPECPSMEPIKFDHRLSEKDFEARPHIQNFDFKILEDPQSPFPQAKICDTFWINLERPEIPSDEMPQVTHLRLRNEGDAYLRLLNDWTVKRNLDEKYWDKEDREPLFFTVGLLIVDVDNYLDENVSGKATDTVTKNCCCATSNMPQYAGASIICREENTRETQLSKGSPGRYRAAGRSDSDWRYSNFSGKMQGKGILAVEYRQIDRITIEETRVTRTEVLKLGERLEMYRSFALPQKKSGPHQSKKAEKQKERENHQSKQAENKKESEPQQSKKAEKPASKLAECGSWVTPYGRF